MADRTIHPSKLLLAGEFEAARERAEIHVREVGLPGDLYWGGVCNLLTGRAVRGRQLITLALKQNGQFVLSDFYCSLPAEKRQEALCNDPHFDWLVLQEVWSEYQAKKFASAGERSSTFLSASNESTCDAIRARLFEVHAECGMRMRPGDARWLWLKDAVNAELARSGQTSWVSLYQGCLAFHSDDVTGAEASFRAACNTTYRLSHSALGAFSFRPSLHKPSEDCLRVDAQLLRLARPSALVFAFACDQAYFDKFAQLVSLSWRIHCPDASLHFHVINPTDVVKLMIGPPGFESVWEHVGLSTAIYDGEHKSFYACSRFLVAPVLLSWYNTPVFLSDIDVCFTEASATFKLAPDFGVGLKIKDSDNHYPWRSIVADFVALDGSPDSVAFMSDVGRYCLAFLDQTKGESWWLDQNALSIAHHFWQEKRLPMVNLNGDIGFRGRQPFIAAPNHSDLKEGFVRENMTRLSDKFQSHNVG